MREVTTDDFNVPSCGVRVDVPINDQRVEILIESFRHKKYSDSHTNRARIISEQGDSCIIEQVRDSLCVGNFVERILCTLRGSRIDFYAMRQYNTDAANQIIFKGLSEFILIYATKNRDARKLKAMCNNNTEQVLSCNHSLHASQAQDCFGHQARSVPITTGDAQNASTSLGRN